MNELCCDCSTNFIPVPDNYVSCWPEGAKKVQVRMHRDFFGSHMLLVKHMVVGVALNELRCDCFMFVLDSYVSCQPDCAKKVQVRMHAMS